MEDAVFKGEIHPLNPRELVPRNSTKIAQTTIHGQEGYPKVFLNEIINSFNEISAE